MSQTQPTSACSKSGVLTCLACAKEVELARDPERRFEPRCPECGDAIRLLCRHCGNTFSPTRWRFGRDGRPTNCFCSRAHGAAHRLKEVAQRKRLERENAQRQEGTRLSADDLEQCRLDAAWEARHGILDRVFCRECGLSLARLEKHGRSHGLTTTSAYRQRYPSAPLLSLREKANSPRGAGEASVEQNKLIEKYLTPQQLIECRGEGLEWEKRNGLRDRVVCRACGGKFRDNLAASHLGRHNLTSAAYTQLYPAAPLRSDRANEDGRRRYQKLASRAYPRDWNTWDPLWRLIGKELLFHDGYMSNREVADTLLPHLSRFGRTSSEIVSTKGFQLVMNRVRKRVKRPGGIAA